jgi:hypothetical protein
MQLPPFATPACNTEAISIKQNIKEIAKDCKPNLAKEKWS